MGLARGTPLLTTVSQVVALTAVQDIANLEADAEFTASATLLRAHEWVYDRLKRRLPAGSLATLTNTEELERAVAFRFLEILSAAGYLGDAGARAAESGGRSYWGDQAREEVDAFQPEFSAATDVPRMASEGLPSVGHINPSMFSGDATVALPGYFSDDFPSAL